MERGGGVRERRYEVFDVEGGETSGMSVVGQPQ